jgi:hypothetical protein
MAPELLCGRDIDVCIPSLKGLPRSSKVLSPFKILWAGELDLFRLQVVANA